MYFGFSWEGSAKISEDRAFFGAFFVLARSESQSERPTLRVMTPTRPGKSLPNLSSMPVISSRAARSTLTVAVTITGSWR